MASLIAVRPPRPFSLSSLLKIKVRFHFNPSLFNPPKTLTFNSPLLIRSFSPYSPNIQPDDNPQNYPLNQNPNINTNNQRWHSQYQPINPNFTNNDRPQPQQNHWNQQNQGYPIRENPNYGYPQAQQQQQQQQQRQQPPSVDLRSMAMEGKVKEIIELMEKGAKADGECFMVLFEKCGNPKFLEHAKKVHDFFLRSTFRGDPRLNNKVVEMYAKCESMVDARRVFDHMPERNLDSWHLMIRGYASNSLGDEGLLLFDKMKELGLRPNSETFQAVLSACAGAEAVEEGFIYLEKMRSEHGIEPQWEHYLGVLDVLGASGFLVEAREYIDKLPMQMQPNVVFWESFRNYARIHGDVDLEDHIDELIADIDPSKAVTNKLPTPPPKKQMAVNFMEGRNRLPEFKNPTLYKDDEKYKAALKEQGYVPDTRYVLHDIDQEAKEQALLYHSESYCLDNLPETNDDEVQWACEFCEARVIELSDSTNSDSDTEKIGPFKYIKGAQDDAADPICPLISEEAEKVANADASPSTKNLQSFCRDFEKSHYLTKQEHDIVGDLHLPCENSEAPEAEVSRAGSPETSTILDDDFWSTIEPLPDPIWM